MINKGVIVIFLLHVVTGIYFVNYLFQFLQIPEYISNFDPWIIFIGGILVFIGGVNYARIYRRRGME